MWDLFEAQESFKHEVQVYYWTLYGEFTASLLVIQNIMKSMNFQLDKNINYDLKHIISQRKTTSRIGKYEHVEYEVLALIANHSYIE